MKLVGGFGLADEVARGCADEEVELRRDEGELGLGKVATSRLPEQWAEFGWLQVKEQARKEACRSR